MRCRATSAGTSPASLPEFPRLFHFLLLAQLLLVVPALAQNQVLFVVNDALVKDQLIANVAITLLSEETGVELEKGTTDENGAWEVVLPAGVYQARFQLAGYVPFATKVEISRPEQIITTTLSKMLESEGNADRQRIRIILNWGSSDSQVKDADSHLHCACPVDDPHVYFAEMSHEHLGHRTSLDVDDMDWGGPETLTILDPPPGKYLYWVHNYSGPPPLLGTSEIAIRVLHGDRLIGDYRAPGALETRAWRPFAAIDVDPFGAVVLTAFSEAELAAGLDREPPDGYDTEGQVGSDLAQLVTCGIAAFLLLAIAIGLRFLRR